MTYAIYFNPNAGNGKAEQTAQRMKEKLEVANKTAEFLTAPDPEAAIKKIKDHLNQYEAIIAIGGDGTLNIVATAFVQAGKAIPFGIIPGGTVNNFAKRWHIPMDLEEAMDVIVAGHTREVGIGACGNRDKAIVSSFAFGTFADISNEVRQQEKQKFGLIVYPIKALKQIGKDSSYKVRIEADSFKKDIKVWFALITTTSSIGGMSYVKKAAESFHVSILHNMTIFKLLQLARFVFTGKLENSEAVLYLQPKKIRLTPLEDSEIVARIDGDKGPKLPLELDWLHKFLTIYVPEKTVPVKGGN
ncbi:diacylglycerol/lipid kinase family protein [Enterococcus sp. AZ109]|uniref:diacylglycerol/lipid kinase family protein n=1 Tax=Enterococcus sp. AZ109 TaxID=2774634 RepID=UPI003F232FD4